MIQKIAFLILFSLLNLTGYAKKLPENIQKYPSYIQKTRLNTFIQKIVKNHHLNEQKIRQLFDKVKWKQPRIKKIKKKSKKSKKSKTISWSKYKKSYLTTLRIEHGISFYLSNQNLIKKIAKKYQVSPFIITAIMGVETNYGKYQGKEKILNTLANRSFNNYYRRDFFTKELESFFILTNKHQLNPSAIYGSSAGAFGMSQFMPTSYINFAEDYDQDGKSDIIGNKADALASIANYFQKHGWKLNEPIAHNLPDKASYYPLSFNSAKKKPKHQVAYLRSHIQEIPDHVNDKFKAKIIRLPEEKNHNYWITYKNFYVITRYNHSLRYGMAVYQLASIIERSILNAKPYVIQKGDTMIKIAQKFNISIQKLLTLNPKIENIHRIYIGQKIWIT